MKLFPLYFTKVAHLGQCQKCIFLVQTSAVEDPNGPHFKNLIVAHVDNDQCRSVSDDSSYGLIFGKIQVKIPAKFKLAILYSFLQLRAHSECD